MKKKLLTLAVALLAATGAWAQTTFIADNLKYTVTDETTHTVELTGYVTAPEGALTIPATVTNEDTEYSVTSIGSSAFSWCSQLTAVTIPEGVATIGYSAFERCSSLTEVNIPASAINIGSWVFAYCSALTAIHVAEDNTAYSSEDGVLFNKDKTTLVCYPIGKTETTYTVPATVTTFTTSAFEGCTALAQINLPNSLTDMSLRTFYGCTSLKEVTLPDGVTRLMGFNFTDCSALEKVTLPEGITYIGNNAFYNCSALTEMTVLATTPPTLGTDVFLNVSRDIPVYVPATSLADYQAADVWSEFNLQGTSTAGLPAAVMPESIRIYNGTLHNPQQLHLTLYDMQGRQVYSGTAATLSQPAGVYVVRCNGARACPDPVRQTTAAKAAKDKL